MRLPAPGYVLVWSAVIDGSAPVPEGFLRPLSREERRRASALPALEVRTRFTLCRFMLRSLLGALLDTDPARVRIALSKSGKPELAGPQARGGLRFSLSHTQDAAVFGFCRDADIGVDVERLRPAPWASAVASSFFGPLERQFLESRLAGSRDEAFLTLWTMKEAYLKARGEGLEGLKSGAQVLPDRDLRSAELVRAGAGGARKDRRWTIRRVRAGKGLAASVAVRGAVREIKVSRWTPAIC